MSVDIVSLFICDESLEVTNTKLGKHAERIA